jgi:hypothetical protein
MEVQGGQKKSNLLTLGILDIYGFEIFQVSTLSNFFFVTVSADE